MALEPTIPPYHSGNIMEPGRDIHLRDGGEDPDDQHDPHQPQHQVNCKRQVRMTLMAATHLSQQSCTQTAHPAQDRHQG